MRFFRPFLLVFILAACWIGLIAWGSLKKISFFHHDWDFVKKERFFKGGAYSSDSSKLRDSLALMKMDAVERKKVIVYPPSDEATSRKRLDSIIAIYNLPVTDSSLAESPYLLNVPINGVYPLDVFFEGLYNTKKNTTVFRVGHYGDSQIEGDRFTSNFRHFFQQYFGGSGYGYIPMDDVTSPVGYTRTQRNWVRHSVFKNFMKNGMYGPGGMTFQYPSDSAGAGLLLQLENPCKRIKLCYGYGSDSSSVRVYDQWSKSLLAEKKLSFKGHYNILELVSGTPVDNIRFEFKGKSPLVYGILADADSSVQFDNYGIRGQTGDGLLTIPQDRLKAMYDSSNTKMAIVQFGGNVVPYLNSEKQMNYYAEKCKEQFLHFKGALPNGSVLSIGLSDVTGFFNGQYQSFPGISEFRYLQRKHAIENGIAFFDLYQFMGGEESNKLWNEYNLTTKDGHFSDKGRAMVCKEICKALLFEYKKFCKRRNLK